MESAGTGQGMAVLVMIVGGYFFPTILAMLRGHHNWSGVAIINILLGWTGLGWVAALFMACTSAEK